MNSDMFPGSINEAIQMMEKGREILEKHLDLFIPSGKDYCCLQRYIMLKCTYF